MIFQVQADLLAVIQALQSQQGAQGTTLSTLGAITADIQTRIGDMLGGLSMRVATGTLTWPGSSQLSSTVTVTHGCPFTPLLVLGGTTGDPGAANVIGVDCHTFGATTFKAQAKYDPTTPTTGHTEAFAWVAFGIA